MSERPRDSSIELLRIVAMYLIIAHHLVVNSGLAVCLDWSGGNGRAAWFALLGMWGRMAINMFVLITGYFMCISRLTPRRFLKLFLEIEFYSVAMWGAMCALGYEPFTLSAAFGAMCWFLVYANRYFCEGFIWFYALIPFYNILVRGMTRRQHFILLMVLLAFFSGCSTFFHNTYVYHQVAWFVTVYFVGAWIRLYPSSWMDDNRRCIPALLLSIATVMLCVAASAYCMTSPPSVQSNPYFLVCPETKLACLVVAVFAFLVFRNIRLGHSRAINAVAATTFGVLLVHGANDGMRTWLWRKVFDIPALASVPISEAVAVSIAAPLAIHVVCSALDGLRIVAIERPLFALLERKGVLK